MGVFGAEGDAVVGDGVLDDGEGFGFEIFEAGLCAFAANEFEVGEFPQVAVDEFGGSFADEDGCAVLKDVGDEAALAGFFSFGELGEIVDALEAKCCAGAVDGAVRTGWGAWGADGGA